MPGVKAESDRRPIFSAEPAMRAKNEEFRVEQPLRRPTHAGVLAQSEQIARWLGEKHGWREGKLPLRPGGMALQVLEDSRLDFEHVVARDSCHFCQPSFVHKLM